MRKLYGLLLKVSFISIWRGEKKVLWYPTRCLHWLYRDFPSREPMIEQRNYLVNFCSSPTYSAPYILTYLPTHLLTCLLAILHTQHFTQHPSHSSVCSFIYWASNGTLDQALNGAVGRTLDGALDAELDGTLDDINHDEPSSGMYCSGYGSRKYFWATGRKYTFKPFWPRDPTNIYTLLEQMEEDPAIQFSLKKEGNRHSWPHVL